MAHMVWGKGGLLNASLGGKFPCLDFAGGTVVHVTSGVSALVCALYLGKRVGYPKAPSPPHSVVLSFIGACLLWVGWFGFNAGSAVAANGLATSAFVNTHFAGAVAGLVAITPASGFVQPMSALVIGAIAGVFCFLMVTVVKSLFGYDDSLDAFGVHGAGGTIGAILTGIFASSAINPIFGAGKPTGAFEGNRGQVGNQFIGVAIAWVLAIVGTLILLKLVDLAVGLRVTREEEIEGLDITQHGEEGYDFGS
jgi:Amt family ammonium transporter